MKRISLKSCNRHLLLGILFVSNSISLYGAKVIINGITYNLYSNMSVHQATVTGNGTNYNNSTYNGDLVIPATIEYDDYLYNVIAIDANTFYNCKNLKSVVIPSTVSTIGQQAFYSCTSLESIALPESVKDVTNYVFYGCTALKEVTLSKSTTRIGQSAFQGCTSLEYIDLPSTITEIGAYAFNKCSKLTDILLPNSVTSLGQDAFSETGLKSISIPSSLTSIPNYAFYKCSNLAKVEIPTSVTTIGVCAFYDCTPLKEVFIPNSVTTIYRDAFNTVKKVTIDSYNVTDHFRGTNIEEVVIGNSVNSIKPNAFYNCKSLTSITFGDAVTTIQYSAFENCTGLTTISLPKNITTIGNTAFKGCTSLTTVYLPEELTTLDSYAFQNCSSLSDIKIPSSVKSIGASAFKGTGLTSISIPQSVKTIGMEAFRGLTTLTSIHFSEGLASIGNGAFRGCTGITEISIPSTVLNIYDNAFLGCKALEDVTINNPEAYIGTDAFTNTAWMNNQPDGVIYLGDVVYGFKGIIPEGTALDFKEGTKAILNGAFASQTGLEEITIPATIKSIGENAFSGCTNLKTVIAEDLTAWLSIEFNNSTANPLYYATDLKIDDNKIASINIPDGITEIKNYAFSGYKALQSVSVPVSIRRIGHGAFNGCTNLISVNGIMRSALEEIGDMAFANTAIKVVDIPPTLKVISNSFSNANSINRVNIADIGTWCSLTLTGTNPLTTAKHLYINYNLITDLVIPDTIETIPSNRFYGATDIKTVTFPKRLKTIENAAFYGCTALTHIEIPDSVYQIGQSAFYGCSNVDLAVIKGPMRYYYSDTSYSDGCIYNNAFYGIKKVMLASEEPFYIRYDIFDKAQGTLYIPSNAFKTYLEEYRYASYYQQYRCISYNQDMMCIELDRISASATSIDVEYHYVSLDPNKPLGTEMAEQKGVYKKDGLVPNRVYYNTVLSWMTPTNNQVRIPSAKYSTPYLTFETQDPEAKSNTKARISAKTNGDDDKNRFGFEWRRNDAPDSQPWNVVTCPVYNGVLAGSLSGLSASTYYDFRPYYKPDEGDIWYGEKKTFITADAYVLFQPEVHTYEVEIVEENTVKVKGYVLPGSEDVKERGFEYWRNTSNARSVSAARSNVKVVKVEGDDPIMTATFTGLSQNCDYLYRAYVKTESGTTYGEEMAFHTAGTGEPEPEPEPTYITGDADGDGMVSVTDIVYIVNKILGNPASDFDADAADVNGDGGIDVSDIVATVNIILNKDNAARKKTTSEMPAINDYLTLTTKNNGNLSLNMHNKGVYVAAQFDVIIPNGQSLESIDLNVSRCGNQQVAYSKVSDNLYRVLVYNIGNQTITGNDGELLSINISGSGNVIIDDIRFVTSAQIVRQFAPLTSNTTGINAISVFEDPVDIYNVNGILVRKQATDTKDLKKGMYIINGKKVAIK